MLPPLPAARSPLERRGEKLQRLRAETFDLLIIGGGITGAAVAREAALRGWRVALVERGDFAGGTSSKSARIIHGGLRYIAQGQLGVVYAACAERRALLRSAPALVRPLAHTAVVYDHWSRAAIVRGALILYDALGLYQNHEPQRSLSARDIARLEPAASRDNLKATVRYYEAVADDARLTLATVLAAERLGALALNYAPVEALLKANGQVSGAAVRDIHSGESLEVRARAVVNATGPWNPRIQQLDQAASGDRLHPSKGIHVVVPRERLPVNAALVFRATDGRRDMYVLPWQTTTIIGTTDTDYAGDLDEVCATGAEVQRVLDSVSRAFPGARLTGADIISTFAGVRPLLEAAGQGAYRLSREHRVSVSASGLVSITGGKFTTHRAMARDTVRVAARRLGVPAEADRAAERRSRRLPLEEAAIPAAGAEQLGAGTLDHLRSAYGARWGHVAALALQVPGLADLVAPGLPYLKAEIAFAVQHEMALTLNDCMQRRTHLIHEAVDQGMSVAPAIAASLARLLDWTPAETSRQLQAYADQVTLTRRYRTV